MLLSCYVVHCYGYCVGYYVFSIVQYFIIIVLVYMVYSYGFGIVHWYIYITPVCLLSFKIVSQIVTIMFILLTLYTFMLLLLCYYCLLHCPIINHYYWFPVLVV